MYNYNQVVESIENFKIGTHGYKSMICHLISINLIMNNLSNYLSY